MIEGLGPYPEYRESGVVWLGAVPAHWIVLPLRRVTLARCDGPFGSGLKSSHYTDHGVRVVRLQNIGQAEFHDVAEAYISAGYCATLGDHGVAAGDVLIAGLGDERHPTGRACIAPAGIEPAMVKADCFRFRLHPARMLPSFAAYHLSATALAASAALSTGATRQRTNLQATAGREIALPALLEQQQIVRYITRAAAALDIAIARARDGIALVREYRTRLVSDVVTGKLDVRAAAARLPAESNEPTVLDASAADVDDKESSDGHSDGELQEVEA